MDKKHRTCSVDGCNLPHSARGFCKRHYNSNVANGDPVAVDRRRAAAGEALEWLEKHVDYQGSECLIWPFSKMRGGYGHLCVKGKYHPAHRLMCKLAHGEPPTPTSQAAHSCGKGKNACVNPRHVRWMSPTENVIENLVLGATRTGEACTQTFLTEREVKAIRRLADAGVVQRRIAEAFGVTPQRVNEIVLMKAWKHVHD